jgi:hypothetical protein
MMARAEGMEYADLVGEILCLATSRCGLEYRGDGNEHTVQVPVEAWRGVPVEVFDGA